MIAIVGDVILDRYWHCSREQRKVNPERPGGWAYKPTVFHALGGAASVASIAKGLGADVMLYGSVGQDGDGEMLRSMCRDRGIYHMISTGSNRTTVKTRIVVDGVLADDRFDFDGSGSILNLNRIGDASVVVVQDHGKGVVVPGLVESLRDRNRDAVIIVDPALGVNPSSYRGADIIKANLNEVDRWGYDLGIRGSYRDAASRVSREMDGYVVTTLGDKGLAVFSSGVLVKEIAAVYVDRVVDVCGAGDTVAAALAVMIERDSPLFDACEYAVACAAVQIQGIGCTPVAPVEKTVEV